MNLHISFCFLLQTNKYNLLQIWIAIKESKKRRTVQFDSPALGAVWIVFAITIFSLTFYQNIIGYTTTNILKNEGYEWLEKNIATGAVTTLHPYVLSVSSLYIMLYAMPTLITGLAKKFKPMIIGAIITYVCFIISCFTNSGYDMLLHAIAGTACWLIPGLILYKKYKNVTAC